MKCWRPSSHELVIILSSLERCVALCCCNVLFFHSKKCIFYAFFQSFSIFFLVFSVLHFLLSQLSWTCSGRNCQEHSNDMTPRYWRIYVFFRAWKSWSLLIHWTAQRRRRADWESWESWLVDSCVMLCLMLLSIFELVKPWDMYVNVKGEARSWKWRRFPKTRFPKIQSTDCKEVDTSKWDA